MAIYVYSCKNNKCICVLEDNRRLYDKPDSSDNTTPRKLLGKLDYNYRVFYEDSYDEAGAADTSGYVYNDMDDMSFAHRVGYVDGNKIYEYVPSEIDSSPVPSLIAYMEGDGDMKEAGAAALLLAFPKGGRRRSSSSSHSSTSNNYTSKSTSYKSKSTTNYTPPKNKKAPIDAGELFGWAILAIIVLIILEKLFG